MSATAQVIAVEEIEETKEELKKVSEVFTYRLSQHGNPLSGDELHLETMKAIKILRSKGEF